MQLLNERTLSEAISKKISLDEIPTEDNVFFEILNKYLIDNLASQYDPSNPVLQENQEVVTFKIAQPRHRTLNFVLKSLGFSGLQWGLLENSYTNHKFKLADSILSIIVKKNVTKDTHVLYHTSANEILALQDLGLTRSQALTSKVIETVGQYNLLVEERRVKAQITTNKTDLKKFIVKRIQHLTRLLQPLERCICNFNDRTKETYSLKVQITLNTLLVKLEHEYEALRTIRRAIENRTDLAGLRKELKTLHLDQVLLEKYLSYDPDFLENMQTEYKTHIEHARDFLHALRPNKLSPQDISDQLQAFLVYQLSNTLDFAQARNDLITANSDDSLFRGKLRDFIVDAEVVVNSYVYDQLNPITKEHQSDFRERAGKEDSFGSNKVLYQSSFHVGTSKEDQEKVLIGITALQEARSSEPEAEVVKSAGWNNFSTHSKGQKLKRFLAWGLTTLCHAPLSALNLVVTTVSGQAPIASLMQKIENYFEKKFDIKEQYNHDFYKYREKLGGNNLYTSTLIGRMLYRVIGELTAVIVRAPKLVLNKVAEQTRCLIQDVKEGLWAKLYRKAFPSPYVEIPDPPKDIPLQNSLSHYEDWVKTATHWNQFTSKGFLETHLQYATPQKPLRPYAPHDLFSSIVHATTGFVEIFKDGVFEKHPVTGFIAALAYAIGGAAVMSPAILQAVLVKSGFNVGQATAIIKSCQAVGRPIAKTGMSQGIASGFTLAKAMGVSMNTASQGFDSALAKIIREVSKDPFLYGVGVCVSYGFGNLITNGMNIPYVSAFCRDDVGTVPALGKIMIGAKLGMISLEAALPEDEETPSILAEFIEDIAHNLMLTVRIVLSPLTLSSKPYTEAKTQLIKGAAIALNATNKILTLTAQLALLIPKNLLEVGTTLIINTSKLVDRIRQLFSPKSNHVVPVAREVLTFKHRVLNIGSRIGLFFRELLSRKPERYYTRAVKSLEPEVQHHKQDYSKIISDLNAHKPSNLTVSIQSSSSDTELEVKGMPSSDFNRTKTGTRFGLSSLPARVGSNTQPEPISPLASASTS